MAEYTFSLLYGYNYTNRPYLCMYPNITLIICLLFAIIGTIVSIFLLNKRIKTKFALLIQLLIAIVWVALLLF